MAVAKHSKVKFFTDSIRLNLPGRTELKKQIEALFRKEKQALNSLNYIFCSDERLLQINKEYLQHDYYTDVITFELAGSPNPVEGEIYISLDRVKDNAKTNKTTFKDELNRVIFHGALHLCGYRDKSKKDKSAMVDRENYYLSLI